jgi:hypothetical protein
MPAVQNSLSFFIDIVEDLDIKRMLQGPYKINKAIHIEEARINEWNICP